MTIDISSSSAISDKLMTSLSQVIKGRDDTLKLLITALFADGHVLLEDYPGSGKTTLTKALGKLISKDSSSPDYIEDFRRIQFTPDLLPGDVLGVNVFEPQSGSFRFIHGPVFAHIVLADEINRTGPKVQAAFLECMAEKQVTTDNFTHPLHELFFVVGTQNPLDLAGTYPLPLVQLDRFLLKIPMPYVDYESELEILENHGTIKTNLAALEPVCSCSDILQARQAVEKVHISPELRKAIVHLIGATRESPLLRFGASTRAGIMLQQATRAYAAVSGRDFCTEDDLKYIAPFVLLHRLEFTGITESPLKAFDELITPCLEKLIRDSI